MKYICQFLFFFRDVWQSRHLIYELTKQDFRSRYLGSYLGILWAFVQPTITVGILWFVFEVGFKSKPVGDFPFILWLATGIFPWFFISESIAMATNSVVENSFLVKKVVFRVSVLPLIKIISALVVHFVFILILFLMFLFYGYVPSIYNVQVIYYLFATCCLVLGISWLTAALVVFSRDIGQLVVMVLQFGFWVTPIFWSMQMVPEKYRFFLLANPCYYLIEGYRNAFVYHKWFWEDWGLTLYFWLVAGLFLCIGAVAFRKLRPHFADVL